MSDSSSGIAAMDDMIARLRGFPGAVVEAAPKLAELGKATLDAAIADGVAPNGEPWPAKKDGGRPLVNASKALTVKAIGSVILFRLSGPEAIHNFGTKKDPKRQILPDATGMPRKLGQAIRLGIVEVFKTKVQHG